MNDKASERNGLDAEIRRLEKQVDELLGVLGALREENRALRQRQDSLSTERATLLPKGKT